MEELRTALRFRGLADLSCLHCQSFETVEEAPVALMGVANVAAAAPTARPQCVQTPVVPDPVGGVALDGVAALVTQARPRLQIGGPTRDHGGDRGAAVGSLHRQCLRQCVGLLRGDGIDSGLGNTRGVEVHR